jgi:archaellin
MTAAEFRSRNVAKLSPEEIMVEFTKIHLIEQQKAIYKEYKKYYDTDRGEYFDETNIESVDVSKLLDLLKLMNINFTFENDDSIDITQPTITNGKVSHTYSPKSDSAIFFAIKIPFDIDINIVYEQISVLS